MLSPPVGESSCNVHSLLPTNFPSVAPKVATFTSVTAPLLAFAIRSVWSRRDPGTITHNQGPSIFGPASGKAELIKSECEIDVLTENLSKLATSDIALSLSPNHVKLGRGASEETSDIAFSLRSNHVKLFNFPSGDTSNISLSLRSNHVKLCKEASGDTSDTSLCSRFKRVKTR